VETRSATLPALRSVMESRQVDSAEESTGTEMMPSLSPKKNGNLFLICESKEVAQLIGLGKAQMS
jgi:hypothetical protein